MKRFLLLITIIAFIGSIHSQTVVFTDDFESGTTSWTLAGTWGTNTTYYHSTNHSLTESPVGNYADNIDISAVMTTGVNLSTALAADLSFWAIYDIEAGFDTTHVDVSTNNGTSWISIASFTDTNSVWTQYTYSLGGFVGNSSVKIRFRFVSDAGWNQDGMYIDDVEIVSYSTDIAPPLIIHSGPKFYEGVASDFITTADIIDVSGIAVAELKYTVDGGTQNIINGVKTTGDEYEFTVPAQPAGSLIEYFIHAVDSASIPNSINAPDEKYISGQHYIYDNGIVDFVDSTGIGGGRAVRVSLSANSTIVGILLRNYTDNNRPNDSMLVHIWSSNSGVPGTDLIPPFMVYPSANLQVTSPMTVIDLRSYAASLANLTGDVFIGFTVPSGGVWATISSPSGFNRSYNLAGGTWTANTSYDFHFRAITEPYIPPPIAIFSYSSSSSPTISFTDNSTGNISSWSWDFGDGMTDIVQNPTHTYTTAGTFTTCLIVNGIGGSDTGCLPVNIATVEGPLADFSFSISGDPTVAFTDLSTNSPNAWFWDFDESGATSNLKDPTHTYQAVGGTYNVCHTASNNVGTSATICKDVVLQVGAAVEEGTSVIFKVYPVPARDEVFIEMPLNPNKIDLKLFDINGRSVEFDFEVLGNGVKLYLKPEYTGAYFLKIIDADRDYRVRLLVE